MTGPDEAGVYLVATQRRLGVMKASLPALLQGRLPAVALEAAPEEATTQQLVMPLELGRYVLSDDGRKVASISYEACEVETSAEAAAARRPEPARAPSHCPWHPQHLHPATPRALP